MALKTSSQDANLRKNGKLKRENKRNSIENPLKEKFESKLGYPIQFAPQFLWQGAETPCGYLNCVSNVYSPVSDPMATYFPQYQLPRYSYPMIVNEWGPMVNPMPTASPIYPGPIPILLPPQVMTQICPYTGTFVSDPMLTSMIPNQPVGDAPPPVSSHMYKPMVSYSPEVLPPSTSDAVNHQSYATVNDTSVTELTGDGNEDVQSDPIEFYLTLPKELFPAARMFSLDPNPIIDEFCKLVNIGEHASWILDLEFGVPRAPITRPIPVYDVQFNSIHCKNTPGAIHPGFETCSCDFKRVFLFYYDCVISTWYKSYIIMKQDKSVENFQSWLLLPMQVFGMCWP